MSTAGSAHLPENLVLAAVLSSLSSFGTAVMSALVKSTEPLTPGIAWIFVRERASRTTWVGAGVGFVGIVLVLQPTHQTFNIGALLATAGAILLAVACISVRRLGATEPTSRILFYYFGISTVLCLPLAIADWRSFGLRGSAYMIGIAVILLISQALIVLAYRYASAVKVGPFVYPVIVFTAVIDWFPWNHAPTLGVVFGIALVIGGAIIAIRKQPTGRPPTERETVKDHDGPVKNPLRPMLTS